MRYKVTCAPCHGADALGGANAPRLVGRAILAAPIGFQRLLSAGRGAMPPFADPDTRATLELLAHLRATTAASRP
jgi:mono/diheme cytochrome c family protein